MGFREDRELKEGIKNGLSAIWSVLKKMIGFMLDGWRYSR